MAEQAFAPAETLEIRGLEVLKIMADARRREIIDLLRRRAATAKEIAHELNVSPKSLYYHINLLEKHGLIRVVDTRLVSGIVEKTYRSTAYLYLFDGLNVGSEGSANSRALDAIRSVFEITVDNIRIGLDAGLIDPDDAAPDTSRIALDWVHLQLTETEREQLEKRICELLQEFAGDESAEGAGTYRFVRLVYPELVRGARQIGQGQR